MQSVPTWMLGQTRTSGEWKVSDCKMLEKCHVTASVMSYKSQTCMLCKVFESWQQTLQTVSVRRLEICYDSWQTGLPILKLKSHKRLPSSTKHAFLSAISDQGIIQNPRLFYWKQVVECILCTSECRSYQLVWSDLPVADCWKHVSFASSLEALTCSIPLNEMENILHCWGSSPGSIKDDICVWQIQKTNGITCMPLNFSILT